MRLLILTQAVDRNDPVLGFFHQWVKEFARHTDEVIVGCLRMGEYELPGNVRVVSLGKERGASRWEIIRNFYRLIVREQKHYDAVFVHMNPEYVVLGGIPWRLLGKRVALWYTHKHVDIKLRVAEILAHVIFTASEESLRLVTPKKRVMGHGVVVPEDGAHARHDSELRMVMVGRLSPVKRSHIVIEAMRILKEQGSKATLTIVGAAGTVEQKTYEESLRAQVRDHGLDDRVSFVGALPPADVPRYLKESDLFVTVSDTGSLDKAPLEAMALGVPVLASLPALAAMLYPWKDVLFTEPTAEALAEHIAAFGRLTSAEQREIGRELRSEVLRTHSLPALIKRIEEELRTHHA